MTVTLFSSSEDLYRGMELPTLPSRDWACWGYASEESAEKMWWNIFDAQGIRLMEPHIHAYYYIVYYNYLQLHSYMWLIMHKYIIQWSSLVAQTVKNLPAMQEAQVWSLGRENPLEKGMATHYTILAWKIPWTEEPGGLQSMGLQRVRHNWANNTHVILHL